jgi:membrane-associated phospholipid phosphatase
VIFALTPWGRALDSLSFLGRIGIGWSVLTADLILLETISSVTLVLSLVALVVIGGVRGHWGLGLRATAAVVGAIVTSEGLKRLLPVVDRPTGRWHSLTSGSFPSGHAVIVASIALAVLSISSGTWRPRLVGPLAAWTAVATTATVTVGWHRPGDVIGSFFLATAWHRALGAEQPEERRLRTMLPSPSLRGLGFRQVSPSTQRPQIRPLKLGHTATWWMAACVLVLGAALEGVLTGETFGQFGKAAPIAYLGSLAILLAGAWLTVGRSARVPQLERVPVARSVRPAHRTGWWDLN